MFCKCPFVVSMTTKIINLFIIIMLIKIVSSWSLFTITKISITTIYWQFRCYCLQFIINCVHNRTARHLSINTKSILFRQISNGHFLFTTKFKILNFIKTFEVIMLRYLQHSLYNLIGHDWLSMLVHTRNIQCNLH
jgi:hypothetical protein